MKFQISITVQTINCTRKHVITFTYKLHTNSKRRNFYIENLSAKFIRQSWNWWILPSIQQRCVIWTHKSVAYCKGCEHRYLTQNKGSDDAQPICLIKINSNIQRALYQLRNLQTYYRLVCTTQVNSTFCELWLVSKYPIHLRAAGERDFKISDPLAHIKWRF